MKTFTTSFAAIIFALFILTSCGAEEKDTDTTDTKESGQDADTSAEGQETNSISPEKDTDTKEFEKEIKVAYLTEPCDFADAMLSVVTEMNALKGELKDGEEPTPEQQTEMEALMKKITEIQKAVSNSKVDMEALEDCPSMKKLENL